jgi:hypothetical protein
MRRDQQTPMRRRRLLAADPVERQVVIAVHDWQVQGRGGSLDHHPPEHRSRSPRRHFMDNDNST